MSRLCHCVILQDNTDDKNTEDEEEKMQQEDKSEEESEEEEEPLKAKAKVCMLCLTLSDFHFWNQNVLEGAILCFWNQYSNIVRKKLSN